MRSSSEAPARWATRVIGAVLPSAVRDAYLGDLEERYRVIAGRDGTAVASRWLRRQALSFVARAVVDRLESAVGRRFAALAWMLSGIRQDLRLAYRNLWARPGFTVPAVAVLALGIAANVVVFSLVDAVLLRDLPYEDPDRLVMLWDRAPEALGSVTRPVTYRHYLAWAERGELFEAVGAFETLSPAVQIGDLSERPSAMMVSSNLFDVLGRQPFLGRGLRPEDDVNGAASVAIISHRFWQTRLGGAPDVIGRSVLVNGVSTEVIGVMPAGFWFYDPYMFTRSAGDRSAAQPDLWLALHTRDWEDGWLDYPALRLMGRLVDGLDLETASAEVASARRGLAELDGRADLQADLVGLSEQVAGAARPRLLVLFGSVAMVLLLAAVNVASLLLARSRSRRAELAVRSALGASRWQLGRTVLAESLAVALVGGAFGLLLALLSLDAVVALAPRDLPLVQRVAINLRALSFTLGVAGVSGLLGGAVPALRLDVGRLARAMGGGERTVAGAGDARVRSGLVALEVALSLTLLIGAGVMLKAFVGLSATDPGFVPTSTLTFQSLLWTPEGETPDYSFYTRLLGELRDRPAVEAVGASTHLPFTEWDMGRQVVAGDPATNARGGLAGFRWVTQGFFDAARITLLAGRSFSAADDQGSPPVAVVDEAFVNQYLDGIDPIGQTLHAMSRSGEPTGETWQVVGVVRGVKHSKLFEAARPMVYVAYAQDPVPYLRFLVRARPNAGDLVPMIREAAAGIDRRQPLETFLSWEYLVQQSLSEERFYAQLLGIFGLTALLLAAVGVYGTVAYNVRLQLGEMGIRKALGATGGELISLVVARGMLPVLVGLAAGAACATVATRAVEAWLHGAPRLDPASFGAAIALFAFVALVATLVPASRAARVDVVQVLRR